MQTVKKKRLARGKEGLETLTNGAGLVVVPVLSLSICITGKETLGQITDYVVEGLKEAANGRCCWGFWILLWLIFRGRVRETTT